MNNISQISIFDYREIENLGDLERLKIFFENINDDKLCEKLENKRKNGRNDYPIRTMLNLIYAMKIYGHRSGESFRRELSRNSQLRIACGLSEGKYKYCGDRKHLVPPARVFTGFLNKLKECTQEIEEIKEELVKFMYDNLERFGEDCAVDGEFLDSYRNPFQKEKSKDNRAEHEATNACKTYEMKDGTKKKEWHYGFRAHIICDAKYGVPIKSKVTPANNSEQTELDNMLEDMANDEKEKYKEIENQSIAYTEEGEVYYIVDINKYEKMKYLGYDKENNALRYTRASRGRKIYRISLETDYRIFTPFARDSKKFKTKYKMRTEVERLNGRIDRDYMFNDRFITGQKKMELMLNLTFIVMLTIAKGHIKNKQENIRSLVA